MIDRHKRFLEKYIQNVKRLIQFSDDLATIFGTNSESAYHENLFLLNDLTCDILEELINPDGVDWISWYIWENDCGERGFLAGWDGNMRPIKNIDDLIWLIEN